MTSKLWPRWVITLWVKVASRPRRCRVCKDLLDGSDMDFCSEECSEEWLHATLY